MVVLGSLRGMGRGLYWIPKVTGAMEGLDLFASWGRIFALMDQKTFGKALSTAKIHRGWD